jgi:hypothetical protein
MTRTWTLMIGLALLWGSVCAGQQGYADMAPGGLSLAGLVPGGDFASFSMLPGSDGSSLTQTLEGVQANLTTFEQCTVQSGLPVDLFPYWSGLPEFAQIESRMGMQPPEQMITSLNIGDGLPLFSGQFANVALPVSTLSMDSVITMPDFAGLATNP